ncbi:MAG: hypothetical protein AAFO94_11955, partial [Bacteroidota bacterium]
VSLTKPADTYRMRYRGGGGYPSPGMIIDYYLPAAASAKLQVDIVQKGKVIRSFIPQKSKKKKEEKETDMATGFYPQGATASLVNEPGAHRFRWDLRHQPAKHKGRSSYGNSGPVVAPGSYTIRLTIDGEQLEQTALVKMDPRVAAAGVTQQDLLAQEQLSLNVSSLLDDARSLSKKLKDKKEKLEKMTEADDDKQLEISKMESVQQQLVTDEGRYQQPMLIDQLRYLKSMLDRADQRPGKDAYDRYAELKRIYDELAPQVSTGDTDD